MRVLLTFLRLLDAEKLLNTAHLFTFLVTLYGALSSKGYHTVRISSLGCVVILRAFLKLKS